MNSSLSHCYEDLIEGLAGTLKPTATFNLGYFPFD